MPGLFRRPPQPQQRARRVAPPAPAVPSVYSNAVQARGPVGYWRLGESSGTTAFAVVGPNGTYEGTPTLGATGLLTADSNTAMTVSGDDNVNLGDQTWFDGTAKWTMTAWVNYTPTANYRRLIAKEDSNNWGPYIYLQNTEWAINRTSSGGSIEAKVASSFPTGTHFVAATYATDDKLHLYLDGVEVAVSTASAFSVDNHAAPLRISGAEAAVVNRLDNGTVDDVAIFDRALTATEIEGLYNIGANGDQSPQYSNGVVALSPSAYYRMDDTSGTTMVATVGPNGSYVNTPTLGVTGALGGDLSTAVTLAAASSEYATVADDTALDYGDVFTLMAWIKRASISGSEEWIIQKGVDSGALTMDFDGSFRLTVTGAAHVATGTVGITDTTTWHMLVVTKSGTARKVYVDGVDVTEGALPGNATAINTTAAFEVGRQHTGVEYFNGSIDEVAVFMSVLTPAQIDNLWRLGVGAEGTAGVSAAAGLASGTGVAYQAAIHIKPFAGFGSGTGTAATGTPTTYVADDFSDTQVDTWAAADTGGTWAYSGTAANYDKTAGAGLLAVAGSGAILGATVPVSIADVDAYARFSVPTTGANVGCGIVARATDATLATCYYGGVWFESDNSITAFLHERAAGSHIENAFVLNQGTYTANQWWWVRFQIIGTDQRVKVWPDGSQEPTAWNTSDTDSTISAAGRIGIIGRSGSSAGAQSPKVDDLTALQVVTVGGSVNIKPNAGIAAGTGLANNVSPHVKPSAGIATGTGSALSPVVNIKPNAGIATGTGLAYNVIPHVKPNAGLATGTGSAHSPPILYAQTGQATGTGTANNASVLIKPNAGLASGTGLVGTAPTTLASDDFSDTIADSFGTADVGGSYTVSGTAADYDKVGGVGTITVAAAGIHFAYLNSIAVQDSDITVMTKVAVTPTGGSVFSWLTSRGIAATDLYFTQLEWRTTGGIRGGINRRIGNTGSGGTLVALDDVAFGSLTYTAGDWVWMRMQTQGVSPTTIRLKIWKDGTSEPANWQQETTDSTSPLQATGHVGMGNNAASGLSNGPAVTSFETFGATTLVTGASAHIKPFAGLASGTGAAGAASVHVKPNAGTGTGTGSAYDATVTITSSVTVNAGLASGTGAANNASVKVSPNAGVSSGTGLANVVSAHVKPFAGIATGTGAAGAAFANVKPNAGLASGTGTANAVGRGATALQATGTGLANNASVHVKPNAGIAAGTGTAQQPSEAISTNAALAAGTGAAGAAWANVKPNAGLASGTGTANNATVTAIPYREANAEAASGTGAAQNASVRVEPRAGVATGTGTANDATVTTAASVSAQAETATGTGAANNASARISPNAGLGSGTGTANTASESIRTNAALASGTGAAGAASIHVKPNAGIATGTGTANNATAQTVPYRTGNAEVATGTGAANAVSARISPNAGLSAGTGTAQAATTLIKPNAGLASGTGTAHNASVRISVNAGIAAGTGAALNATASTIPFRSGNAEAASGTGTALNASVHIKVNAGIATGTGAAVNPTINTSAETNVAAELASGTGTANQPSVAIAPRAGIASGTGAAQTVSALVAPNAGLPVGTGAALGVSAHIKPNAQVATGSGTAFNATVLTAPYRYAAAGVATGTGSAGNVSAHVKVNAGLASGTGAAFDATVATVPYREALAQVASGTGTANNVSAHVKPNAGLAAGSGTAFNATVTTVSAGTGNAEVATGTGAAHNVSAHVKPNAGLATGTGSAFNATASTVSQTSAQAGLASGTGTANNASVRIEPRAGLAAGTGLAQPPRAHIKPNAQVASGTGTAFDADVDAVSSITFSLNAVLLRTQSGTFSLNAVIRRSYAADFGLSAMVRTTAMGGFSLEAVLRTVQIGTVGLDAVIFAPGSGQFALSALLRKITTASFGLDAYIVSGTTGTFSLAAVIKATLTDDFGLNAVITTGNVPYEIGFSTEADFIGFESEATDFIAGTSTAEELVGSSIASAAMGSTSSATFIGFTSTLYYRVTFGLDAWIEV